MSLAPFRLQGKVVPRLLRHGALSDTDALFLALSDEGDGLGDLRGQLTGQLRSGMEGAVRALHAAGVAHGDVRLSNFVVDTKGVVKLLDLEQAVVMASSPDRSLVQADLRAMSKL